MARFTLKSALASLTLAGVLAAAALPTGAQAAHHASPGVVIHGSVAGCHSLRVQLNGDQSADVSCGDAQPTGEVGPLTSQHNPCQDNDLKVYDSPGESGNSVCFYGNGYVDFSAIPYPGIGQNWNDRASSYGAHGYSGRFYMNVGETGSHWDFYAGTSSNFGGVWDNTVSSMCIASGPTSCPGY